MLYPRIFHVDSGEGPEGHRYVVTAVYRVGALSFRQLFWL